MSRINFRNLDRLLNRHFRKPSPLPVPMARLPVALPVCVSHRQGDADRADRLSLSLKKGEGVLIGYFPLLSEERIHPV